jgi:dihydroxy-acid dehydratase
MARTMNIPLTLDDFQEISDKVPFIADLKPSGKYVMEDVHKVGGIPAVLKYLLENKLLHGDCLTVTGKTMAENLEKVKPLSKIQDVIRPLTHPIKPSGHIQILYGNLAPEGSVAKITGKEGLVFEGTANVFDSEEDMLKALEEKKIKKGDVIIIRYEGPKGGNFFYKKNDNFFLVIFYMNRSRNARNVDSYQRYYGCRIRSRCCFINRWSFLGRISRKLFIKLAFYKYF